jgi:GTPase
MDPSAVGGLASRLMKGDRRALSRAITLVEDEPRAAALLMRRVRRARGGAFILGVTGPPGTGKSTLVDKLVKKYREGGSKVGVVAVDPTSPITGGALLGDRVRMADLTLDDGVFIRSMASRGWSGGLSRAAARVIQLMNAAGYELIIIETVGIGQSDIEVVGVAHAVLVVLMPGIGDDVQVSKAGLMEVGDVYVVNKSDLEGADVMIVDLLSMTRGLGSRSPSVLKVSALKGEGIDGLVRVIDALRDRLRKGDRAMQLRSTKGMIMELARAAETERFLRMAEPRAESLTEKVLSGELSVEEAADRLLR